MRTADSPEDFAVASVQLRRKLQYGVWRQYHVCGAFCQETQKISSFKILKYQKGTHTFWERGTVLFREIIRK